MKFSLINIFLFFSSVFCHMAMKDPPPRKSQFSEYYLLNNDVDYLHKKNHERNVRIRKT